MYNYKETIKKENTALCKYRREAIKKDKWPWILLAISIIIPAIIIVIPSCESFCCKLIKFLENLSFGLLTGLVVYIFVTFLPSTRKRVKSIDAIYYRLYVILKQLDQIYNQFAPQNSKKDFRVFETLLYNFLVKGAQISDFNDEDQLYKSPIVNKDHYNYLIKMFSYINININNLITSYSQDIRNEDISTLLKITELKSDLTKALINDDVFNKELLKLFVTYYSQLYCFEFPHVYREYERYKYWEPMYDESLKEK